MTLSKSICFGNLSPAFGRREIAETDAEYKLEKFAVSRPTL